MERWPAWSAPLLGGFGGGLAGLALTADHRFPFSPVYATLGGITLGGLAGLVVWLRERLRPSEEAPTPVPPDPPSAAAPSRWAGVLLILVGAGCIAANHMLVIAAGKKFLPLVLGGAFFLALGLAGVILPQLLSARASGQRLPWWSHLVGGLFAFGGLALGMYLWLVVY